MDTGKIVSAMNQQLGLLHNLEDLIAHDAKEKSDNGLKPGELDALKKYVTEMKNAADYAITLANHYSKSKGFGVTGETKPTETKPVEPVKKPVVKTKPAEAVPAKPELEEADDLSFLD